MCAYTLYIPHVSLDTSRDTRALMCMSYRAIQIKHLQRQTPSRRPPSIQTGSLRIRCVGCDTIHTILYSRTHETFEHPNTHQNQRGLYETGVKSERISTLYPYSPHCTHAAEHMKLCHPPCTNISVVSTRQVCRVSECTQHII